MVTPVMAGCFMAGLDLALPPSCPHFVVQMLVPLVPLVAFPYQKRMVVQTCGVVQCPSLAYWLVIHAI